MVKDVIAAINNELASKITELNALLGAETGSIPIPNEIDKEKMSVEEWYLNSISLTGDYDSRVAFTHDLMIRWFNRNGDRNRNAQTINPKKNMNEKEFNTKLDQINLATDLSEIYEILFPNYMRPLTPTSDQRENSIPFIIAAADRINRHKRTN